VPDATGGCRSRVRRRPWPGRGARAPPEGGPRREDINAAAGARSSWGEAETNPQSQAEGPSQGGSWLLRTVILSVSGRFALRGFAFPVSRFPSCRFSHHAVSKITLSVSRARLSLADAPPGCRLATSPGSSCLSPRLAGLAVSRCGVGWLGRSSFHGWLAWPIFFPGLIGLADLLSWLAGLSQKNDLQGRSDGQGRSNR